MHKAFRNLALAAFSAQWLGATVLDAQPKLPVEPPVTPADSNAGLHLFHHENVLGTSLEMRLRSADGADASRAEAAALAEIDRCNGILSAWQPESEFSRWTRTKGTVEEVSPELLDVLTMFDGWRKVTGGALDASAETATRLWQNAALVQRVPTEAERATAVAAMQQPHWKLDRINRTAVHLDDAPLALNSFVKSYILDRAATAAMAAGATGVSLNLGGDVVLRGDLTQRVAVANPSADAENDAPMDLLQLSNRAVATSGTYRRGVVMDGEHLSHILDPRTAQPAMHVLSATVLAPEASEAGALATAFSVMQPEESQALAAQLRHVDYLLVMADGRRIASPGWSAVQLPQLRRTAYAPAGKAMAPAMDLVVTLELAKDADPRFRRPYVAVWLEDKDHYPVKTLALWFAKARWLPELHAWYHDDQVRAMAEGTDLSQTISAPTRPPGKYTLRWDGKDQAGKPVKPGKYTVCIEVNREHGTYQIIKQEIDFDGKTAKQASFPANTEMGGASIDYGVHP